MNLVYNDLCTFCESQVETLIHLFWDCSKIRPVVNYILDNLSTIDPTIEIKNMHVLLGYGNNNCKVDILFLACCV